MFQPGASLTFDNVKTALNDGLQAIAAGQTVIDFAALTAADSSAVATLLAWRRAAFAQSKPLAFVNLPDNLRSLISLYDVSELLTSTDSTTSSPASRTDLPHH